MYVPTFPYPRPYKIYPNWDFWFENVPSGNPASRKEFFMLWKKLCLKGCDDKKQANVSEQWRRRRGKHT
jgi:hypothetical protein